MVDLPGGPPQNKKPGTRPLRRRVLGDQLRWKMIVEVAYLHNSEVLSHISVIAYDLQIAVVFTLIVV